MRSDHLENSPLDRPSVGRHAMSISVTLKGRKNDFVSGERPVSRRPLARGPL